MVRSTELLGVKLDKATSQYFYKVGRGAKLIFRSP